MTSHDSSPRGGLKVVAAIGQELDRALAREASSGRRLRRVVTRRSRRAGVLALAGGLLTVGAAGAATGVLPVGSAIPSGADPKFQHDGPSPEQTVVATGRTPAGGAWQMTAYKSEGIVDDRGDVAEPAGMPCVLMTLVNPPAQTFERAGVLCHAPGKSDFNKLSLVVIGASSKPAELILYGFAPKVAKAVELTGDGGTAIRTQTYEGRDGAPGNLWVIAAPPDLKNAQVTWIDQSGAAGATRDASSHFDRLAAALE